MNKKLLYKILYGVSALLLLTFFITLGVDYHNYDAMLTSAPFYAFIWIRAIEFLLPSSIAFTVALILNKKMKK